MDFKFVIPTTVECGVGISDRCGTFMTSLGIQRVLLVTDRGIIRAGLLNGIESSLSEHGIAFAIYDEVEPNPSAESIMRGVQQLHALPWKADAVLAVGGGSSIDTAKGIAVMVTNSGHILDYEGVGLLQQPGLPLVVIPTTAGTGSEVTASTIVTNKQTQFKAAVISPYLFPKLALLDAALTLKLPQPITAATGMDALTHAIESYISKQASPASQALAIQAIRMIGQSLYTAYTVQSIESREQMLVASMLAGAAFAQSRLGNVHAISHTLGGVFDIAHGIANAALLPFVMAFNLPACPERMRDIAEALGCDTRGQSDVEAGKQAIERVVNMNASMNIPDNIKDLGVTLDVLPKLVADAMRSGNVLVNPRATTPQDIQAIIENAYAGRL